MKGRGGACSCMPLGTFRSVLMSEFYHKEYHYIWFRGGDLNGFRDIKPFIK